MEHLCDDCWWRGTILCRRDDSDPDTGGAQFEVQFVNTETSDCATASLRPLLEVRMLSGGDSGRLEVQQPAAIQPTHTRKRRCDREANGGTAAAAPPKKRAAVVECSAIEARALHGALYDARRDNPREAHPGPLEKRRRLAQQEPAGCDISAAGCWERGDKHVEALEWQI